MLFKNTTHQHWLEFLMAMTEKEIKARYKHATLGFLWIILNPLLQMVVIGFIFQFFVPVKVDNYFLFLFAGLLPWNFFSYSLTKTTPSIVFERSLIQKANFPREAIPLSIVLSHLFHFLVSLLLLIVVVGLSKLVSGSWSFDPWFLLLKTVQLGGALIWITLLTSGFSLLFSALNVRFRDTNFAVQALMPLWFYATPVVYTLGLLPTFLHGLAYLNPMTAITELFQWSLLNQPPTNMAGWWISIVIATVSIGVGAVVFRKESPFFDDWI